MHPDLTLDDESRAAIDALDAETRGKIGERWQRRAQAELETGLFFSQLLPRVLGEVKEPQVVQLFANAPGEEVGHAQLCLAIGGFYLERALEWPTPRQWPEPAIDGVDARTETTLLVTSMCCINEALASTYLRACHRAATVPIARRVLHSLLGDEIHHAQAGWAFLASRTLPARFVLLLVDFNLTMWLARVREDVSQPAHGYLDVVTLENELRACVDEVVLAGFRHLGLYR